VGGAVGEVEFGRDVLPAAGGGEHEPDDPDYDPMANPGSPTLMAMGCLGERWWASFSTNASGMLASAIAVIPV